MSKFLFQPLKPFLIYQGFGQNRACIPIGGGKVIGCDGLNPPPGYKSIYGPEGHLGIDLAAKRGQPVYAAQGGVIEEIDADPRSGLDVRIVTNYAGRKYRHIYEHLLGYQHTVGTQVEVGDLIGWADNTGWSSGDHLHFQLEIWENNDWKAIDPMPYMEMVFALDFSSIVRRVRELTARVAEFIADWMRKR